MGAGLSWPAVLLSDTAVGGLNPAQAALIYHLLEQPSYSGLDVCFVPLQGVNWDHVMLSKGDNENRPSPFPAGFSKQTAALFEWWDLSLLAQPGSLPGASLSKCVGQARYQFTAAPGGSDRLE